MQEIVSTVNFQVVSANLKWRLSKCGSTSWRGMLMDYNTSFCVSTLVVSGLQE